MKELLCELKKKQEKENYFGFLPTTTLHCNLKITLPVTLSKDIAWREEEASLPTNHGVGVFLAVYIALRSSVSDTL